jgi:hypothetical protein
MYTPAALQGALNVVTSTPAITTLQPSQSM